MIDCHAHLADPLFDGDRSEVLQRAREAGIYAVIAVSETLADAERNIELASEHPAVLPAAGLHPTHVDPLEAERLEGLIRTKLNQLVAIGEVGLDHWKVKEPGELSTQREIFARFIELSRELDLPLNVHSRSAGRETVTMLLAHGARKVQLHAFDARAVAALPAVEAGYFFSIPPSIVRSRQKQKLVRRLPLSCLLLETDSPALSAVPGERNEPARAAISLAAIAEIKGLQQREVAEAVEDNASRLFGHLPVWRRWAERLASDQA